MQKKEYKSSDGRCLWYLKLFDKFFQNLEY